MTRLRHACRHESARSFTSLVFATALVATLGVSGVARADRPEAVITELQLGQHGSVSVIRGQSAAFSAQPLMTLTPADTVAVQGDARAVVLLGSGTTVSVTSATSPLRVGVPTDQPRSATRQVIARVFDVFTASSVPQAYVILGARAGESTAPTVGLRYLPDAMPLYWRADANETYDVGITGPDGMRWSHRAASPPLRYPAEAPRLAPAVYELTVRSAGGKLVEHAVIEVVGGPDGDAIRSGLAALDTEALPPSTKVLVRAAYLASARLLPGARSELEAAIARWPREPSLRILLARVCESLGRSDLAEAELEVARELGRR